MDASYIFLAFLFLVVVSVTMTVMWYAFRLSVRNRIQQMNQRSESLSTFELPAEIERPRDRTLEVFENLEEVQEPAGGWHKSPVRKRLMMAGFPKPSMPGLFYTIKIVLTLGLCIGSFVFIELFSKSTGGTEEILITLLAAAAGYLLPEVILDRLVQARQKRIRRALPEAADFLVVCVEAGTALDGAFMRVAQEMKLSCADLAREMHWVTLEFRAGRPRAVALQNLAERTGVDDVETLTNMLNQADRFGTSTASALRVFSDMLRVKRKQEAQEKAAKIPVKMLFPLIFFIFPALLVVLIGPAMVQVSRVLLPAMGGN